MLIRVGLVSVFVAGAACGGSSPSSNSGVNNNPPGAPGPPGPQVVNVSMIDNQFSPATPTVKVGTTVKWTNNGSSPHTTTSDASPPVWNSTVTPGGTTSCDPYGYNCQPGSPAGTYQRSFDTAGTYQYHCELHPQMRGTITVTP
jgi:plastocyanin